MWCDTCMRMTDFIRVCTCKDHVCNECWPEHERRGHHVVSEWGVESEFNLTAWFAGVIALVALAGLILGSLIITHKTFEKIAHPTATEMRR